MSMSFNLIGLYKLTVSKINSLIYRWRSFTYHNQGFTSIYRPLRALVIIKVYIFIWVIKKVRL